MNVAASNRRRAELSVLDVSFRDWGMTRRRKRRTKRTRRGRSERRRWDSGAEQREEDADPDEKARDQE